jgi:hypothetical protein
MYRNTVATRRIGHYLGADDGGGTGAGDGPSPDGPSGGPGAESPERSSPDDSPDIARGEGDVGDRTGRRSEGMPGPGISPPGHETDDPNYSPPAPARGFSFSGNWTKRGAQYGMTFGGPPGAAIGVAVGAVLDLAEALIDMAKSSSISTEGVTVGGGPAPDVPGVDRSGGPEPGGIGIPPLLAPPAGSTPTGVPGISETPSGGITVSWLWIGLAVAAVAMSSGGRRR